MKKNKWVFSDIVDLGKIDDKEFKKDSPEEDSDRATLEKILSGKYSDEEMGELARTASPAVADYLRKFHLANQCVEKYLDDLKDPTIEGFWVQLHEEGGFTVTLCRCSQPHGQNQSTNDPSKPEKE